MIQFERSNPALENILRGECRFPAGPVWLFHVGTDGLAREIVGRVVRPGQRYLLICRTALQSSLAFMSATSVDCAGVKAVELSLPDFVSPEDSAQLHKLGIQVARNIRVWPAGLCVRNWDGEGHGDWLTNETPCFGIVHDHAIDEYFIRLNGGSEMRIEGGRANSPIFVRLDRLPPGKHFVTVTARRVGVPSSPQLLRDLEGRIELKVRDPAPWTPGTTSYAGLSITIEPRDPSLDAFWEGNVGVTVLGPVGRSVICGMSLVGRDGTVLSEEIGNFDLPITASHWSRRFKRFTSDETRTWKYLEAATAQLSIKGDELGQYTLQLERERKPIRWVCHTANQNTNIRLIDDTGQEVSAQAEFFSFRKPATAQALDVSNGTEDIIVQEPGGLYLATQGEHSDAIVVSSTRAAEDFRDLIVEPEFDESDELASSPQSILRLATLWKQARFAGSLADSRRDHIAQQFLIRFYRRICGERWYWAEHDFMRAPTSQKALNELERAVGELRNSFPVVLRREFAKMNGGLDAGVKWFCDKANRYEVNSDAEFCTFALRLASYPFGIAEVYGSKFESLFTRIEQDATLLRGARLVVLLCVSDDNQKSMSSLPGWPW